MPPLPPLPQQLPPPPPAAGAEVVVSHVQLAPLRGLRASGETMARVSLDLGLTESEVDLRGEGVVLPDGRMLSWADVDHISDSPNACFRLADGIAQPVRLFSSLSNRLYSLVPTRRAPTLMVSGMYMHRVKGTDPVADTDAKLRAVAPVLGAVLDTTTGLGYTAVAAARSATRVVTVERDPAVIEIARANPWSRALFQDARIERLLGDSAELVPTLPHASFDRIIHDPPRMSLAGELYSGAFYRELHRVLRPRGRLFHYVGDPRSDSGARVGSGVVKRLRAAGFRSVTPFPEAYGYVAVV